MTSDFTVMMLGLGVIASGGRSDYLTVGFSVALVAVVAWRSYKRSQT